MKLSIAIASANAAPSAFVVWRGFEESIAKAKRLGYHGVELALKSAEEFREENIADILGRENLQVSCISTGQLFAALGLCFTHHDPAMRKATVEAYRDLIRIAGDYGGMVNIGRARGPVEKEIGFEKTEELFLEGLNSLSDDARRYGVEIVIEPVNRYEINYLNTLDETVRLLRRLAPGCFGAMPDVFHMNIEDDDICASLERNAAYVKYVHLADSNRYYPGCGHMDFAKIIGTLHRMGYDGWCSVEILPKPSPDIAAQRSAEYLLPLFRGQ